MVSATDALGITSSTSYLWDNGTPGALYYTEEQTTGAPAVKNWYDMFNRGVKTETQGFSQLVSSSKTYNGLGQLASSMNVNGVQTFYGYDGFQRPESVSSIGGTTSYGYAQSGSNYKTTVTSPAGVVHKWVDASGKLMKSEDVGGGVLEYTYDASGPVRTTKFQGQQGNLVSMEYDDLGFQESLNDMNAGSSTYEYNSYGELIGQRVNWYDFTMDHDVAGRLETKNGPKIIYNPDGSVSANSANLPNTEMGTSAYEYVTSGNGLNQIKKITAANGTTSEYVYDEFGRTLSLTETIDTETFTTSSTYDALGRVNTMTYPSGLTLTNGYDANGYLATVSSNGTDLFAANESNAYGQLIRYSLGNGKTTVRTYDDLGRPEAISTQGVLEMMHYFEESTGNLKWRRDDQMWLREDFDYDGLNRLKEAEFDGVSVPSNPTPDIVNVLYDPNGNITSKTDAGVYEYWDDRPNAVKSITNPLENISQVTQNIVYTTEGRRVAMITEEPYRAIFTYGTDNQRKKMVLQELNTITQVYETISVRYYHGAYEKLKIFDSGNVVNTYWTCNKKVDSELSLMRLYFGFVKRFDIQWVSCSSKLSVCDGYYTKLQCIQKQTVRPA